MHKRFLLTMFYVSTCICTKENGNEKTEPIETTPFEDSPLVRQLKGMLGDDKEGLELLQKLRNEGKEEGRKEGMEEGRKERKEEAESKFFWPYFECFVNREKRDLKVYKDNATKSVYTNKEHRKSHQVDNLKFPDDIREIIEDYDNWVLSYDAKLISNENNDEDQPAKSMTDLLTQLQKTFVNWYLIMKCEGERCPRYVERIRVQLDGYYKDNLQKYGSIDDVHLRFAASMSRGYKIMCVMYHKLKREFRIESDKNGTASFTDILFQCVPDFLIDYEQFSFYSYLRHALQPKIAILQHIIIKNRPKSPEEQRKWTLIPYDNSKWCNNVQNLNELPDAPTSTVKVYHIIGFQIGSTSFHLPNGKTVNNYPWTKAIVGTQN